mgnify:CR=1 FL=1
MPTAALALRIAAVYLASIAAGYLFHRLGLPLPWMIGPIFSTALLLFNERLNVTIPVSTRPVCQAIVAAQVGLAFSPAVLASLVDLAPLLIGMALLMVVTGFAIAVLLSRMGDMPFSAALIATLPTSPVEAAVIAERYGIPRAPVILTQTMRIGIVVVAVPLAIVIADGQTGRSGGGFTGLPDPVGLAVLALVTAAGMVAGRKLRIANPFFLGPLALSSAVTAAGIDLPDFPSPVLWGAQVVLGTWLGSNFRRSLFARARRMVAASVVSTILFIAVSGLVSATLSRVLDLSWETLVLASTPGGVTEMALTAKFLGIDVALITAFHLVRIFIVVPSIPLIMDRLHRRGCRGLR